MNQTSVAFAVLFFAFVIYVTTKGELPKYLSIFGLGPDTAPQQGGASPTSGGSVQSNFFPSLPNFMSSPLGQTLQA